MVRTDSRITEGQTHPQTTGQVSVETYRPRGETIGFKKKKMGRKLNRAEAQIETKHINMGAMTKNRRGKRPNG